MFTFCSKYCEFWLEQIFQLTYYSAFFSGNDSKPVNFEILTVLQCFGFKQEELKAKRKSKQGW